MLLRGVTDRIEITQQQFKVDLTDVMMNKQILLEINTLNIYLGSG